MKAAGHCILALCLAALAGGALAQHAHSHGLGQLEIVVDQDHLRLTLLLAQHDLVGFERAAKTAREQLRVQAVLEKLKNPAALFVLPAGAECMAAVPRIDAPLLTGGKSAAGHGHADVEAHYVFRCARPSVLDRLSSQVTTAFPHVRALTVNFAGPRGQKAGRLDARKAEFSW